MQEFKFSDLARNSTDVRHAAARAPITITERNKPRFVMMTYEAFEALRSRTQDPRRVLDVGNLSPDDKTELLAALEGSILPEDR
ncbi:type II toxin-antitoxin system prevent-host-death family antitoxin [Phenylobacterium sp. LjRoot219]|uniref:type II toxin-antitoxin system prevent-host-death family antitoxin n=1 Tax=Phenylobacterium sp. LjRoot219 TaxID=3342283 RepID=UPI003ECC78C2